MTAADQTKVIRCHNCNEVVSIGAIYCPGCRVKLKQKEIGRKTIVAVLVLIPIVLIVIKVFFNRAENPPLPAKPQMQERDATVYKERRDS